MDKPKITKEVAFEGSSKEQRSIFFSATENAVDELEEFGFVEREVRNLYRMHVDSRYSFEEVENYIKNYGVAQDNGAVEPKRRGRKPRARA